MGRADIEGKMGASNKFAVAIAVVAIVSPYLSVTKDILYVAVVAA